jgi:hypothetical protein
MKNLKTVIQEAVTENHKVSGHFHSAMLNVGWNGPFFTHYKSDGRQMPRSVEYRLTKNTPAADPKARTFEGTHHVLLSLGFREGAGSPTQGHSEDIGNFIHRSYYHPDTRHRVDLQTSMDGTRLMYHNPEEPIAPTRPTSSPYS